MSFRPSWGRLGLDETAYKTMATSSNREPPNTAAGRKGANYTSLNLQSYKGPRDGKGFGKLWCQKLKY